MPRATVLGTVGEELVGVAGGAKSGDFDTLHARSAQLAFVRRPQVEVKTLARQRKSGRIQPMKPKAIWERYHRLNRLNRLTRLLH